MKKPVILTILDGYGLREEEHGNAIKLANMNGFEKKAYFTSTDEAKTAPKVEF